MNGMCGCGQEIEGTTKYVTKKKKDDKPNLDKVMKAMGLSSKDIKEIK